MSKLSLIKQIFYKHPIISNSIIYGTLCVGAEFSQQTLTKKILSAPREPYDVETIGRYVIYGTSLGGPILSIWYRWLDKKFIGTATKIIAKKVLLDQFFLTPQLLVVFYVSMSLMENRSDLFKECREKFLTTFQKNCMFWMPAQTINFFLIPPAFRVVYVGTCSFAWINILCWIKRQNVEIE